MLVNELCQLVETEVSWIDWLTEDVRAAHVPLSCDRDDSMGIEAVANVEVTRERFRNVAGGNEKSRVDRKFRRRVAVDGGRFWPFLVATRGGILDYAQHELVHARCCGANSLFSQLDQLICTHSNVDLFRIDPNDNIVHW
jgi:hypothetical protein